MPQLTDLHAQTAYSETLVYCACVSPGSLFGVRSIGRCRVSLNTPWTMAQQECPTTWLQDVGNASDIIKQSQSIPRVSIFGRSVVSYTSYCMPYRRFQHTKPPQIFSDSHGDSRGDPSPAEDYRVNELRGRMAEKVITLQSRLQNSGIGEWLILACRPLNYG